MSAINFDNKNQENIFNNLKNDKARLLFSMGISIEWLHLATERDIQLKYMRICKY